MEGECSVIESVEDNEAIGGNEKLDVSGETVSKFGNSDGSCSVEQDKKLVGDVRLKGERVEDLEPVNLLPTTPTGVVAVVEDSGSGSVSASPSTDTRVNKGHGLRKWRRIRREVTSDGVVIVDSSKLLKRGLPNNAGVQSGKAMQFSAEMKQRSKGSVSSTNAVVAGFAKVGGLMDTGSSEDQSSKSLEEASVQRVRHDGPIIEGNVNGKSKMKSLSGKNLGSSVERVQQAKAYFEISKKPRGERSKIEKENSHSSMESDSRSSCFAFVQDINSLDRNGRLNGGSMSYGGEKSRDAQNSEGQNHEEIRQGYVRRNGGDFEDVSKGDMAAGSSCGVKEENGDNKACSNVQDPLAESIRMLQSAQEALEKEVQEYREIGKEDGPVDGSSLISHFTVGFEDQSPSSLQQLHPDDHVPHAGESYINSLKGNINILESKLAETTAMLKGKESRMAELEAAASSSCSTSIESELEALFRAKIELEVKYLTISSANDTWRNFSILEEQKKLVSNKLRDAESQATSLKNQVQQLESNYQDISIANETLKLQITVRKYTVFFLLQLILLAVFFLLLLLQLSPQGAGVVPT